MNEENKNELQAYSDEILEACRKGKLCNYGICDECPNIINSRSYRDDES